MNLRLWPRALALQCHLLAPSGKDSFLRPQACVLPLSPVLSTWAGLGPGAGMPLALPSPFRSRALWGRHGSSAGPVPCGDWYPWVPRGLREDLGCLQHTGHLRPGGRQLLAPWRWGLEWAVATVPPQHPWGPLWDRSGEPLANGSSPHNANSVYLPNTLSGPGRRIGAPLVRPVCTRDTWPRLRESGSTFWRRCRLSQDPKDDKG